MEDGIHPLERLERIAVALESIAGNLSKIANPPIFFVEDSKLEEIR